MMQPYMINIFSRVIKRKLEANPVRTLDSIFTNDYPKLTQEDRDAIGLKLNE